RPSTPSIRSRFCSSARSGMAFSPLLRRGYPAEKTRDRADLSLKGVPLGGGLVLPSEPTPRQAGPRSRQGAGPIVAGAKDISMTSGRDRRKLGLIDEADREAALFFVRWLKAPHRIGAVAPSSRHLGRAMARQVLSAGPGPIIELGGGTGSVTKALLEASIAPERLI